jgi:hypothetical protein
MIGRRVGTMRSPAEPSASVVSELMIALTLTLTLLAAERPWRGTP